MSTAFQIRVATLKDELAINNLLEASYPVLMQQHYDRDTLSAAIQALTKANSVLLQSGKYHVAEIDSTLIVGGGGWSHERPGKGDIENDLGHIRHFATHANWIGQGIARAIYDVCEQQAVSEGLTSFECHSSLNAEGFYTTLGFESVCRMEFPMGSNLTLPGILMRRSI